MRRPFPASATCDGPVPCFMHPAPHFVSAFRCPFLLATCLLVPLRAAPAQSAVDPTWGFISARYSSATADFIFAGYGHGPVFGMVGMVNNPRSGYTEVLGGVGARFPLGAAPSHAVALAASRATESWYTQLYYLPTVTLGRIAAEATLQLYMPAGSGGVRQFGINPLSVLTPVVGDFAAGASYQLGTEEHAGPRHAAGPALRVTIPKGALTLDLLRGLRDFNDEARVSFRAFF